MRKINFLILMVFVAFSVMGCGIFNAPPVDTFVQGQQNTETTMASVFDQEPTHVVTKALERANVNKRIDLFATGNKLGYVYMFISGVPTPMGYYTVMGKISSLNSFNNPQQKILDYNTKTNGYTPVVVDNADVDGTWGHNIEGVFFFTDSDVYVEIPVNSCIGYQYTTEPLPFNVPRLNVALKK